MSARESILAAIAAKVATATGFTAYRSRAAAVARSEGTVAIVEPVEETARSLSDFQTARELTVGITFIGRSDTPDQDLDAPIAAMHAKLLAEQTLGGLSARIVEESTRWNIELADVTAAAVECRYVVHYMTPASSLASLA